MTWFILLAVLLAAWGWYSSNLVMRMKRFPVQIIPSDFDLPYEAVDFSAADGVSLCGWFVKAAQRSEKTIIICHGYGANRGDVLPSTYFLSRRGGYNLFYFDFRNHGESGGKITTLGFYEVQDLEAAITFLKTNNSDQSRHLAVYGQSMGGAVALTVTASHPEIEGVAAESSFTSYNRVVARFARMFYYVPRFLLFLFTMPIVRWRLGVDPETASPIYHVDKIAPRPVLFIQGDRDMRMPVDEGEALFAHAKEPKEIWTVPGADHVEISKIVNDEFERRVLEFYAKVFK